MLIINCDLRLGIGEIINKLAYNTQEIDFVIDII